MLCLTDCKTAMQGRKVIDKLKHTSHHFVKLMPQRYWESTSQKKLKVSLSIFDQKFSFRKAFCLFFFLFFDVTRISCNLGHIDIRIECESGLGHYVIVNHFPV